MVTIEQPVVVELSPFYSVVCSSVIITKQFLIPNRHIQLQAERGWGALIVTCQLFGSCVVHSTSGSGIYTFSVFVIVVTLLLSTTTVGPSVMGQKQARTRLKLFRSRVNQTAKERITKPTAPQQLSPGSSPVTLAAGAELRNYMLKQWSLGAKTNDTLCTEAWLATQAGAVGVEDLALNPSSKGRNHARHVRDALGLNELKGKFYFVWTPLFCRQSQGRTHRWASATTDVLTT